MYRLFYHPETLGDILFLVIDEEAYPNEKKTIGEVTCLYQNGKLVGANLFKVAKERQFPVGMIASPSQEMIAFINKKLAAFNETIVYEENSGYKVAEIRFLEEHPLDEKMKIVTLKVGDKQLVTTSRYPNLEVGEKLVIALDGCIKFDGSTFHSSVIKNIPHEADIANASELHLGDDFKLAYIPEDHFISGDDFYYKKAN